MMTSSAETGAPPSKSIEVLRGIGIIWLCNGAQLLIGIPCLNSIYSPIARVGIVLVFGLPLVQLVYVVPLAVRESRARRGSRMAGIVIGAVLSSLMVFAVLAYIMRGLSALR